MVWIAVMTPKWMNNTRQPRTVFEGEKQAPFFQERFYHSFFRLTLSHSSQKGHQGHIHSSTSSSSRFLIFYLSFSFPFLFPFLSFLSFFPSLPLHFASLSSIGVSSQCSQTCIYTLLILKKNEETDFEESPFSNTWKNQYLP